MDESHSYTDDWKQAKQETGNTHMGKGLATSRSRGSLVGSGNYLSSSELVTQVYTSVKIHTAVPLRSVSFTVLYYTSI